MTLQSSRGQLLLTVLLTAVLCIGAAALLNNRMPRLRDTVAETASGTITPASRPESSDADDRRANLQGKTPFRMSTEVIGSLPYTVGSFSMELAIYPELEADSDPSFFVRPSCVPILDTTGKPSTEVDGSSMTMWAELFPSEEIRTRVFTYLTQENPRTVPVKTRYEIDGFPADVVVSVVAPLPFTHLVSTPITEQLSAQQRIVFDCDTPEVARRFADAYAANEVCLRFTFFVKGHTSTTQTVDITATTIAKAITDVRVTPGMTIESLDFTAAGRDELRRVVTRQILITVVRVGGFESRDGTLELSKFIDQFLGTLFDAEQRTITFDEKSAIAFWEETKNFGPTLTKKTKTEAERSFEESADTILEKSLEAFRHNEHDAQRHIEDVCRSELAQQQSLDVGGGGSVVGIFSVAGHVKKDSSTRETTFAAMARDFREQGSFTDATKERMKFALQTFVKSHTRDANEWEGERWTPPRMDVRRFKGLDAMAQQHMRLYQVHRVPRASTISFLVEPTMGTPQGMNVFEYIEATRATETAARIAADSALTEKIDAFVAEIRTARAALQASLETLDKKIVTTEMVQTLFAQTSAAANGAQSMASDLDIATRAREAEIIRSLVEVRSYAVAANNFLVTSFDVNATAALIVKRRLIPLGHIEQPEEDGLRIYDNANGSGYFTIHYHGQTVLSSWKPEGGLAPVLLRNE